MKGETRDSSLLISSFAERADQPTGGSAWLAVFVVDTNRSRLSRRQAVRQSRRASYFHRIHRRLSFRTAWEQEVALGESPLVDSQLDAGPLRLYGVEKSRPSRRQPLHDDAIALQT